MSDTPLVRYTSSDDDSMRWHAFQFRHGDIVISTRSKSGTTWVQMICALLIFGEPELPAPLPCYGAGENSATVRVRAFGQLSKKPVRGPYLPAITAIGPEPARSRAATADALRSEAANTLPQSLARNESCEPLGDGNTMRVPSGTPASDSGDSE
jgi:hypothetical protein